MVEGVTRSDWARGFYESHVGEMEEEASNGEVMAKCPFHDDKVTSLSINLNTGQWYCHACGVGGDEFAFVMRLEGKKFNQVKKEIEEIFGPRPESEEEGEEGTGPSSDSKIIPEETVAKYQKILGNNQNIQHFLLNQRGLKQETLIKFRIGYDVERITIPIYDREGNCVNIRRYSKDAKGANKMLSYKRGYGQARLYPIENLEADTILLTEGEMDALLACQFGYSAITSTGGASTWRKQWNPLFKDKKVLICYDVDKAGIQGAERVAKELHGIAKEIRIIRLPILDPPNGDITDFFVSLGHTKEDLDAVIEKSRPYHPEEEECTGREGKKGYTRVHLSQASRAEYVGEGIEIDVIVAGKDTAPFGFPRLTRFRCVPDGKNCVVCPVGMANGDVTLRITDDNRVLLELINCSDTQQLGILKKLAGIPKNCSGFRKDVVERGNVEEVILQPELDFSSKEREYTTRVAYVVGHGITANQSYRMRGITVTEPRQQYIAHLIKETEASQDNISMFQMSQEKFEKLKVFQPSNGESVKEKIEEIHNDLEMNVTHIYGRKDVMMAVDIVYHSVLAFNFQGQRVNRGWCEALVIGDTRTGKSETAMTMMNHYKLGEFVTGENTSFAGLIGGMQQTSKRWFVTWGKIPLNDRRLVILDEASGLHEEAIGNMSGVRSSGVAEIVKLHQEKTHARTRLLWISNTRTGRSLSQYSYGCEAVQELIGKNEDVARFEFVVSCASEEVSMDIINRRTREIESVPHTYTYDLCKQLILWAWSREPDQICFTEEATDLILQKAKEQAGLYTSQVPLVEGANQRIKLARIAVAVACRVFSTDNGERVVVKPEHVKCACEYLEEVYAKPSLGYHDMSFRIREQERIAERASSEVLEFLRQNEDLARILLLNGTIGAKDIEDLCDLDSATVRRYLKFLSKSGMISKASKGYVKQPAFIKLLREGDWNDQ